MKNKKYHSNTLLNIAAENVSENIVSLNENKSDEKLQEYILEVAMPFIRFLTEIELETRFDLV